MDKEKNTLQKEKNPIKILSALVEMAVRLNLSSNAAILLWAANESWTNAHATQVAVSILERLAAQHNIFLHDDEAFFHQLLRHGVFTVEEGMLFGYIREKAQAEPAATVANGRGSVH